MKVVFNGTVEKHSSGGGGCNCKGKVTSSSFVRSKSYIMPSGRTQNFYVGKSVEVSEEDGKFLLSYRYKDANGSYREVFSKVE